ncbi:MAG: type II toxin-antitoxin system HicB family antitoxin [Burkholderiales bacterium]
MLVYESLVDMKYRFSVLVEHDKDGYFAFCPELQGCYSQGNTYEEALENIKNAIQLHVEDRIAEQEEIPEPIKSISLSTIEVTA